LHIAGRAHQRDDRLLGQHSQLVERFAALELFLISRRELVETLGLVVVPGAQFFRRRNFFQPDTHPQVVLAESSRPQPVHQDAPAVIGTQVVIDPGHSDSAVGAHEARVAPWRYVTVPMIHYQQPHLHQHLTMT
jgi:hypothetical protein